MFTGEQLAAWAEMALAVGAKYWYGTCWYDAEEGLLTRKQKQYPSHYTSGRMATYRKHIAEKRMVCDCVGLIKGFFWTANGTAANKYKSNGCPDTSANGMINLCDETGAIKSMPEERGILVWRSGHIGIYIGNGKVIEARGYKYGVVKTDLHARGWTKWGRLPEVMLYYPARDGEVKPGAEPVIATPLLKKGTESEAVEHVQQILMMWNPKALPTYGADGEFGNETRTWVKRFQKAFALEQDGIVGPKTWKVLLEVEAANRNE